MLFLLLLHFQNALIQHSQARSSCMTLHLCCQELTERKCELTVYSVCMPRCMCTCAFIWGGGVLLLAALLYTDVGVSLKPCALTINYLHILNMGSFPFGLWCGHLFVELVFIFRCIFVCPNDTGTTTLLITLGKVSLSAIFFPLESPATLVWRRFQLPLVCFFCLPFTLVHSLVKTYLGRYHIVSTPVFLNNSIFSRINHLVSQDPLIWRSDKVKDLGKWRNYFQNKFLLMLMNGRFAHPPFSIYAIYLSLVIMATENRIIQNKTYDIAPFK